MDFILFVLFIIGTICNIVWSNRRAAAQKAHISFFRDKVKFLSEMTPEKITEYHNTIKNELEEIIKDLEKKLENANNEINLKEKKLSVELEKQDFLKGKVEKLQNEIKTLNAEAIDTEKESNRLQLLNKNLYNRPVGEWFLLFKNYKNQSEEINSLVSSDKNLDNFLQEKIDKGMDEKSVKRFWKQLESELWEQFLDETSNQANLWIGTNKNKKGKWD